MSEIGLFGVAIQYKFEECFERKQVYAIVVRRRLLKMYSWNGVVRSSKYKE